MTFGGHACLNHRGDTRPGGRREANPDLDRHARPGGRRHRGVCARRHDHGGKGAKERLFTSAPDPAGNPEGIASTSVEGVLRSITVGGDIYRGTLGSDTVEPFIEGGGASAIGIKVKRGKLYVAAGGSDRLDRGLSTSPPRPCSRSSRPGPAASSTTWW